MTVGLAGCGSGNTPHPAPNTVIGLSVSPSSPSIAVGATQQFTATATYANGSTATVTTLVTWTSSAASVATVASSGIATAAATGSTTITAALSGVTGTASLTVSPAPPTLSSIAITPATATVAIGATEQFSATGTYSDGSTSDITSSVSWSSSSSAVATVNSSGLATAVAAGSATITATLNGVSATASVTVPAPPPVAPTLTSIAVAPATASVAVGSTEPFTATASYSDGTTANVTSTATWATANAAVATIAATGIATGVGAGSTTVTATLSGVSGTSTLTVALATPTLTAIAITPASPSIATGATQQFTATATYSDGSTSNISSTAVWTSSTTTVATINAAGLATAVAAGSTTITATAGGMSATAALTVTAQVPSSIAVTPNSASFATGSTQQFTATATYSDGSTADITSTAKWTSSNTAVATIASSGLATGVAAGSTTIAAALQGVTGNVTTTVTIAPGTGVSVTTWQVDSNHSGNNAGETSLTPANVSAKTFGKDFSLLVDGYVYGEPLVVSGLTINGAKHNVLFVATENDTVYAFDADSYNGGQPLWKTSLLQAGETPITNGVIRPDQGVTSTPVIDPSTNTLYVVSTQSPGGDNAKSTFRLNALDLATGQPKFGSPITIQASVPGTNSSGNGSTVTLTTACLQRSALTLANNNVYIGFGSCLTGWLLAYNAQNLTQTAVFNGSPNLNADPANPYPGAAGIWMSSAGPAVDSAGNLYVTTADGPWDGKTAWGDSVLKLSPTLTVQDYFTPDAYEFMNCNDGDLGSGGVLLIPGTTEALTGGKTGKLYLLNTANLGQEQPNDAGATQTLWFEPDLSPPYQHTCTDSAGAHTTDVNNYHIFGTAAYFNGNVYLGITPTTSGIDAGVRQFSYNGQLAAGPWTQPYIQINDRGTTPFISSNGTSDGIVWMIDQGMPIQEGTATAATLRAYDAANFPNELYDSSQNSADVPGFGIKFTSPVVANGKVYISTAHDDVTAANPQGEIDVYGLK